MLIYKDGIVKDYREFFPNVCFPQSGPSDEFLQANGCKKVSVFKEHNRETQKLVAVKPYESGNIVYTVKVVSKTEEEIQSDINSKAANIRAQRDRLLKDSDWTQGRDVPQTIYEPWATYRESLRNLPEQEGFPNDVVWPVSPNQQEQIPE